MIWRLSIKSTIVIAGGGHKVRYLIDFIKDSFEIVVVDLDKETLQKLKDNHNVNTVLGDATSDYVLRKANIDSADYLVAFTNDEEINYEISVIGKRHNINHIISYVPTYKNLDKFAELGVTIVGGPKDVASFVYNKIAHTKKAIGVGLGIGEIVEITVEEYSPLANKTLSQISLYGIRIGAIYREDKLIVPNRNSIIKPNDKVLLIGYPQKLEYAVSILTSARIEFPMQYGNTLLVVVDKYTKLLKEAKYLKNKTHLQYLKILSLSEIKDEKYFDDLEIVSSKAELIEKLSQDTFGMLMIAKYKFNLLCRLGFKECDLCFIARRIANHIPILVSCAKEYYKKALLFIFEDDEELIRKTVHTAISIQNTMKLDLDIIVCEIESVDKKTSLYDKTNKIATRIFTIHKRKCTIEKIVGNPVKEFEKIKNSYDLAIIGGTKKKNSLFSPNPACYIASQKGISVFVVLK